MDYIGVRRYGRDGKAVRRNPLRRPVRRRGLRRAGRRTSRCCAARSPTCWSGPASARAATATGGCTTSWRTSRATSCSRSASRTCWQGRPGHPAPERSAAGQAVCAPRSPRPLRLHPALPAAGRLRSGAGRPRRRACWRRRSAAASSAYYPSFTDNPLASVHYIIGVAPGEHLEPDIGRLEAAIAEVARTWESKLRSGAARRPAAAEPRAADLLARYGAGFPAGYRDLLRRRRGGRRHRRHGRHRPRRSGRGARSTADTADPPATIRLQALSLERGRGAGRGPADPRQHGPEGAGRGRASRFAAPPPSADVVWAHEFTLEPARRAAGFRRRGQRVSSRRSWRSGTARREDDGFNRLVLELGVSVARGRADARALPAIASSRASTRARRCSRRRSPNTLTRRSCSSSSSTPASIRPARATLRRGWRRPTHCRARSSKRCRRWRASTPTGSCGAWPRSIRRSRGPTTTSRARTAGPSPTSASSSPRGCSRTCPAPKPFREIFVAAPSVEGVHLRMGPIARGGIRWSDRRDDFRTEVLGLVKAQKVKNAVIVPVGVEGRLLSQAAAARAARPTRCAPRPCAPTAPSCPGCST